ncbi:MAG: hypothetical protein LBB55_03270 [Zoogloeaceae bacterium]|jgi:hypothetical protein|nr:hypothetical protein [Zoogloeaceae bacterium]
MRYLIALAFCFLLASPQAHACQGVFAHVSLFFDAIPDPQPDADVIAKVSLSNVIYDGSVIVTATVEQVLKTSDARVRRGGKITMRYMESSCGPGAQNGEEGIIITKTDTDSKGRLVLYPYTYRRSDGLFFQPSCLRFPDYCRLE